MRQEKNVNSNSQLNSANLKSADVILFAPNNELIIGDSINGMLYAFSTEAGNKQEKHYNLRAIDIKIAEELGVNSKNLRLNAMAVHPVNKEVYISVHRGTGLEVTLIIIVIGSDGKIRSPKLELLSTFSLPNIPDYGIKSARNGTPLSSLSITDITYHKGFLYVSGLTNADFSSSLHKIPYPFNNECISSAIEIYHAVHNQNETRAPIRAQTIIDYNNESVMIAAYTCTPIVTIPINALQDKALVKGKTVADIGYGNTPTNIIAFKAYDNDQKLEEYVMVLSKQRNAQVFTLKSILDADNLSKPIGFLPGGVASFSIPLSSIIRISDYSDLNFVILITDINTGCIDLLNIRKGIYFRLTDHLGEYEMPGYQYQHSSEHEHLKSFQNMLLKEEGSDVTV